MKECWINAYFDTKTGRTWFGYAWSEKAVAVAQRSLRGKLLYRIHVKLK